MNAQPSSAPASAPAAVPDFLAPVFSQYPLPVVSAEGVWLHTRGGGRVLDLYGGRAGLRPSALDPRAERTGALPEFSEQCGTGGCACPRRGAPDPLLGSGLQQ